MLISVVRILIVMKRLNWLYRFKNSCIMKSTTLSWFPTTLLTYLSYILSISNPAGRKKRWGYAGAGVLVMVVKPVGQELDPGVMDREQ